MSSVTRNQIQAWLEAGGQDVYVCNDCNGIHLADWEEHEGVLEARLFLENNTLTLVIEMGIRPSAVLPLQGAIHFMNNEHLFLKLMLAMSDDDVPRVLLSHALPANFVAETLVTDWLQPLLAEASTVYQHLQEIDVLFEGEGDLPMEDAPLH